MKQQKTINLENAYRMLKEGYELAVMNADNTRAVGYIWMEENRRGYDRFCFSHAGSAMGGSTIADLRRIFKSMDRPDYSFTVITDFAACK